MTDEIADLKRIQRIQEAIARQREGEARTAEAAERAQQRDHAERAEMRAAEGRRRHISGFLNPRSASVDIGELLVLHTVDASEAGGEDK